jgi:hypothetical protein
MKGIVINLNSFGATVRLENGELATAPLNDVETHQRLYDRALTERMPLDFERRNTGRRPCVMLAPQIHDKKLDEQIALYLKSTEEREIIDGVPAHERHFLRKKKRATLFEPHPH